jgi:ankyrin repeat protein
MYRCTTPLGLVATSVHPVRAGVQGALIDILLNRGASLDRAVAPDYTDGRVVNACLANGRAEGAEFLATRGARLDLEGAAGVGRLVRSFFNEDGSLKPDATANQMQSGFNWACSYGRLEVVVFLLEKGVNVAERRRGETGLHWAAYGGHVAIVKVLLE